MEDKAYIGRTDEELIERYKAGVIRRPLTH